MESCASWSKNSEKHAKLELFEDADFSVPALKIRIWPEKVNGLRYPSDVKSFGLPNIYSLCCASVSGGIFCTGCDSHMENEREGIPYGRRF